MKVPVTSQLPGGFVMRYLSHTAASYVGVDLHARTLHLCVSMPVAPFACRGTCRPDPAPFLEAIAPFRPDLDREHHAAVRVGGLLLSSLVIPARSSTGPTTVEMSCFSSVYSVLSWQ